MLLYYHQYSTFYMATGHKRLLANSSPRGIDTASSRPKIIPGDVKEFPWISFA